jgi:hypothetical protein
MTSKSGSAGRNCSTKRWKRPSRRATPPRSPAPAEINTNILPLALPDRLPIYVLVLDRKEVAADLRDQPAPFEDRAEVGSGEV